MKKKSIVISIATLMVFGVLIVAFVSVRNNTIETKNITFSEPKVYQTIYAKADFVVAYDNYDKLMSDAELIAFGTVNNVTSYMDGSRIVSKFDFKISSVDKGDVNINDTILVKTVGGKIIYSDYISACNRVWEIETSPETESEEEKLHGNEYIESIWEGVPNVKNGDQLVLFLSKDEENSSYNIVGSSYYGQFHYDIQSNEIYKETTEDVSDVKNNKNILKRKMIINRNDFKKKTKESKDNSKRIREENIQKKIKLNEKEKRGGKEVEIDHSFDKYKK